MEVRKGNYVEVLSCGWKTVVIESLLGRKAKVRFVLSNAVTMLDLDRDPWRKMGGYEPTDVERCLRRVAAKRSTSDCATSCSSYSSSSCPPKPLPPKPRPWEG